MIVFGHSGGAMAGAIATFARPEPTVGCLGRDTLGTIDALVTWEGNWVLSVNVPDWNGALETNGAFTDGKLDFAESQQLLFSVLKAQGNPVSLDVMPDSIHDTLAGDGWKVFLASFPKAAARD